MSPGQRGGEPGLLCLNTAAAAWVPQAVLGVLSQGGVVAPRSARAPSPFSEPARPAGPPLPVLGYS